jgi:CHAD domain-containing protein
VPDRPKLWTLRASALRKARRAFRQADPEGLHDTRVALRRIGATAAALGKEKVSRKSKALVRRLSERRQLEVDRELLGRVAAAGLLSREAAAGLDARWDALLRSGEREAERVTDGRKIRRLVKMLERLSQSPQSRVLPKLEQSWRDARKALASPPDGKEDRELHRYRLAVKRARYLAEDLAALGVAGLEEEIARTKAAQTALGRWNDIRLFRERLERTRGRAEKTGAVSLSAEIGRLLSVLDGTIASARKEAVRASRQFTNVVPIVGRTA